MALAAYPELTEASSFPGLFTHLSLLGLAPDGGCLAAPVARRAGGLLRRLFTLTGVAPGGLFLWPDPAGNRSMTGPAPGVTRHRTL